MAGKSPGAIRRMIRPVRLDEPIRTSVARGGVYSMVGLAAQGILRFATSFLIGHLAGKSELGVVATAISTSLTLALLWPTSAGSGASKFLARARGAGNGDETGAIAAHLRTRTVQSAVALALATLPIWIVIDHGSWSDAVSVAALTLAYSGYSFTRGIQFGAGQIQRATCWDVTTVVLGLAGLSTMLLAGVRGSALVLPLVLTYGLYTLASWPYAAHGKAIGEHRRELDGFVTLAAIGSLASAGFLQLSQIVAKLSGGNANAGQYAAALSLATPASLLAGSLSLVLLPTLSEAWGRKDHKAFRTQTDQATHGIAVVMVAIFGTIGLCSRLIVGVIWGSRFAGAEDILPILVVAVLATNLGLASVSALTTRSQWGVAVTTISSIVGMGVGAAFWFTLSPELGLTGVALGYLCGTVVIAGIPVGVVWHRDGHRWSPLFGRVLIGLAVGAALVVLEHASRLPLPVDLACAAVFLAVWWALNRADVAKLPIPGLRRKR
ncbi:MAG TPA: lipopolysaccharide biosynthesis protein [Pseudonocardiaceae bacterium]|jgi:putative peptidoglycan lipid II flippase|nr:lipopolysaccharide biosynthesis protein [Pseudonocardiaceae bacterium]